MIGYLDCSTGVSGDKFLGALLDIGTQTGAFTAEHLLALATGLAPEVRVSVERVRSHGIAAVGVQVSAAEQPAHRHWRDVRELLQRADLPEPVRASAFATFEALAVAEAFAHGTDVDSVHFHEVGALDSIVDVVGVCAGLHALGVERLVTSPVATGAGTVETSHGTLPVPAPATASLLIGIPTVPGPAGADAAALGELTTPTGAALVRTAAQDFGLCPPMTPALVGYGAGTRDVGMANVCRLVLGEPSPTVAVEPETVTLLETNVDHISPEALAFAAEQLLAEGALDVWVTPIVMKKSRAALKLSALVTPNAAEQFAARVVALTGSLGVRASEQPRFIAPRDVVEIETEWGAVRVKRGAGRLRPEADDVARVAEATGRGFGEVEATLTAIARQQLAE